MLGIHLLLMPFSHSQSLTVNGPLLVYMRWSHCSVGSSMPMSSSLARSLNIRVRKLSASLMRAYHERLGLDGNTESKQLALNQNKYGTTVVFMNDDMIGVKLGRCAFIWCKLVHPEVLFTSNSTAALWLWFVYMYRQRHRLCEQHL